MLKRTNQKIMAHYCFRRILFTEEKLRYVRAGAGPGSTYCTACYGPQYMCKCIKRHDKVT